jgi:hypothetical protein
MALHEPERTLIKIVTDAPQIYSESAPSAFITIFKFFHRPCAIDRKLDSVGGSLSGPSLNQKIGLKGFHEAIYEQFPRNPNLILLAVSRGEPLEQWNDEVINATP